MRIFFYGHAAGLGAGHFARSLRLAEQARALHAEVMLPSPGPALLALNRSAIPLLELPAASGLATDVAARQARAERLLEFLHDWKPDAVVVDTVPFGHGGEMLPSLEAAARERWKTAFWWGLPYAEARAGALRNPRLKSALQAYRGVLVYAEPDRHDPVPAYQSFPLPGRIHHVGVVAETLPPPGPTRGSPLLVALVGSGALKGVPELFAALIAERPEGTRLRLVCGPLAARITPSGSGVEVLPEASLATALQGATAVVARAGYNTAYSLMGTDLPVLLLATAWPEQFQRAEQLADLPGVLSCREEEIGSTLGPTLARLMAMPRRPRSLPFRLDGARRAVEILMAGQTLSPALEMAP
jgi:predicted glycosyltransferase